MFPPTPQWPPETRPWSRKWMSSIPPTIDTEKLGDATYSHLSPQTSRVSRASKTTQLTEFLQKV